VPLGAPQVEQGVGPHLRVATAGGIRERPPERAVPGAAPCRGEAADGEIKHCLRSLRWPRGRQDLESPKGHPAWSDKQRI